MSHPKAAVYNPDYNTNRPRMDWCPRNATQHAASMARQRGFTFEQILAPDRRAAVVQARRHIAMTLRDLMGLSYPRIGQILQRHHTSILNLCGRL